MITWRPTDTRSIPANRGTVAVAGCALWFVVAPATLVADDVRIGKYWHRQVTIEEVQQGTIVYTDSFGNEHIRELEHVQAIKIPTFEELGRAQDALDAGDAEAAVVHFTRVQKRVRRPPWLKHWIQWQTMNALARSDRPARAVAAYLALDRIGADAFYLTRPPTAALGGGNEEQKRDVRQRLTDAMPALRPEARAAAQVMLRRIAPVKLAPSNPMAVAAEAEPDTPAEDTQQESAVALPKVIDEDDETTLLLRAGKFKEALRTAEELLSRKNVTRISMRWYQRGVAKVGLADRNTRPAVARRLYKDAGLDFMRVVVYFPAGVYRAPALVEAGYVHHMIGQPQKARQLYAQAVKGIRAIKPKLDPKIHQRLQQLLKAVQNESIDTKRRPGLR